MRTEFGFTPPIEMIYKRPQPERSAYDPSLTE